MTRRCRPPRRGLGAAALGAGLLVALSLGALAGEAARFVAGLEDLPLMPGLSALEDAGLVFDTPQGRIVEAFAAGPVTRAEVAAFYTETLPQLGWRMTGTDTWSREGETLRMEVLEDARRRTPPLTVRFALSPN
jgi:hypothetical protein